MYKVTAIKNGKFVKVKSLEVVDEEITAVHYVYNRGQITWDFPKDLDEFKIEKGQPNRNGS